MTLAADPAHRFKFYVAGWLVLFAGLAWALTSCSSGGDPAYSQQPDASYTVQDNVKRNCGGCHGVRPGLPVFDTGAHFKASKALTELRDNAMPPAPYTISVDDKQALVAFLTR